MNLGKHQISRTIVFLVNQVVLKKFTHIFRSSAQAEIKRRFEVFCDTLFHRTFEQYARSVYDDTFHLPEPPQENG